MEFSVTSGSFDPAFGEAGGLWVGSATGLQSWDLASGALHAHARQLPAALEREPARRRALVA